MTDDELAETLEELARLSVSAAWLNDPVNRWLDDLDAERDTGARRELLDTIGLSSPESGARGLGHSPGTTGAVQHDTDAVPADSGPPPAPLPREKRGGLRRLFSPTP